MRKADMCLPTNSNSNPSATTLPSSLHPHPYNSSRPAAVTVSSNHYHPHLHHVPPQPSRSKGVIHTAALSSIVVSFAILLAFIALIHGTHFLRHVNQYPSSTLPPTTSERFNVSNLATESRGSTNEDNLTTSFLSSSERRHPTVNSTDDMIKVLERWNDDNFASSHLKVYVYDLPTRYNVDLVERSHAKPSNLRDPYCDTNFYSSEVHVHRMLLNSSVRVTDGNEADLFYVPIYTTCDLINYLPNNLTRVGGNFEGAMKHVIETWPFWNESNGRNHVFLFSQGFSARLAGDWNKYKNAIFMVHNGEFTASEYTIHKDFTIPPYLGHYLEPIWRDNPDGLANHKLYFGQFGGQVIKPSVTDHRGTNHSKGVRVFISQQFGQDPDYRITGHRATTYTKDISRSVFCFAPEGWHPWTPRPYYGVLLGCIPVIISKVQEMAFEQFVDWDEFSIWIKPEHVWDIDAILRAIPKHEVEQKRASMRRVWRLFWYGEPDGLAFPAILRSLYLRKLDSRPKRRYATSQAALTQSTESVQT